MADRVFCIDFGSAFTKVALRRDPGTAGRLMTYQTAGVGTDFCLPSTVAVDRRGAKPVPEFGERAAALPGGHGIDIHRNWKRRVFEDRKPTADQPAPLEAMLRSDEFEKLAGRFGVPVWQVAALRQVTSASFSLAGQSSASDAVDREHRFLSELAFRFFRWLREEVLTACAKLPAKDLKYDEIPTRLTVPSFGTHEETVAHPGTVLLKAALDKAGWPLHLSQPVVTEPYANAIGVLTSGENIVQKGKVQLRTMFGKGPLMTVLKDSSIHPTYRALVVDVGAYTTDFAAITLNAANEAVADPDERFRVVQQSVPTGVSNLDDLMKSVLPKDQAEWLAKARPLDFFEFQKAVYADQKGFRRPGVGVIGGPKDTSGIRDVIANFATGLADYAVTFLKRLEPLGQNCLQELIITGGGSHIPDVREAMQSVTKAAGFEFVKTHACDITKKSAGTPVNKLDATFTRGGSALGGVSVFFEREYY